MNEFEIEEIECKYKYSKIEDVFRKLISKNSELTELFTNEVNLSNYIENDNIPYIDIIIICSHIIDKKLKNLTSDFEVFFDNVEEVYVNGDSEVQNFIVIGLFEGIQNVGGQEIDYYRSFNQWLKEKSQKAWDELIDYLEGTDWRIPEKERLQREKEVNKILNRKNHDR